MDETTPDELTDTEVSGSVEASLFDGLQALDGNAAAELGIGATVLLIIVLLAYLIASRLALPMVAAFAERTSVKWDDILIEKHVFHRLVPVVPLVILQFGIVGVPGLPPTISTFIATIALCLTTFFIARSFTALLETGNEIYRRYSANAARPIKGYIQVVQVVTYIVAGLLIVSFLVGRSPLFLLSGLGAMTAVLLLVFRDSLLSFVAGIQLTQNDLIRVGDWIEMPQFSADGDVIEIALNVVTVQNWDRTITVIPTHKFLEHSFRNWRGMADSGGRRIKRSIHLDLSSVRFLNDDEIKRLRSVMVLRDYIDQKLEEISEHNKIRVPGEVLNQVINQRKLTNVGTFRAYITAYLRDHPKIHKDLTFLIRQLEPTPRGLPMEVYVFTTDIRWVQYEGIQADIFDHLLSIVPEFGLRVFQEPSGSDFGRLSPAGASQGSSRVTLQEQPVS